MLDQLLFVRIRSAEKALREGRLDDAYRLATAPDIRSHKRGVAVLETLAKQFLDRARGHYRADQFPEANSDLVKARAGNVLQSEIAELHDQVATVEAEFKRNAQSRHDRVRQARHRIEHGSLAAGRRILEQASQGDTTAKNLQNEIDGKMSDVEGLLRSADQLASQGQWASAADRLRKAKRTNPHHPGVIQAETKMCDEVCSLIQSHLQQGKLMLATHLLDALGDLGDGIVSKKEVGELLATVRKSSDCFQSRDYAGARRHLLTADRMVQECKWIKEAMDQLRHLEDISTALRSGPLGETMESQIPEPANTHKRAIDETIAIPHRRPSIAGLPGHLLLLVDGGGSFLILRNTEASIGRIVASQSADIPLFSDLAERHANIARVDDDYFLFSPKDVEVAGRTTKHQLLRDGDRIVLGQKAKFTFRMPSRKSPTGVLDLSDTTKMPNDVRRVVLMQQHVTIGFGPTAHIPCRHAGTPLILFERKGQLWIRQKNNGHVATSAMPLNLREPMEIGGVSMVLNPWQVRLPGRIV